MYKHALIYVLLLIAALAITQQPTAQDEAAISVPVLATGELNIYDEQGNARIRLYVSEGGSAVVEMGSPDRLGTIRLEVAEDNSTSIDVQGDRNSIYVSDLTDGLEFAVFVESGKGSLMSLGHNFGENDIYLAVNSEHSSIFMDHDSQEKISLSARNLGTGMSLSDSPDDNNGIQLVSSPLGSTISIFDDDNNENRITAGE